MMKAYVAVVAMFLTVFPASIVTADTASGAGGADSRHPLITCAAQPLEAAEMATLVQAQHRFLADPVVTKAGDSGDMALGILICFGVLILIAAAAAGSSGGGA